MTTPARDHITSHPDHLLLPYVQGLLEPRKHSEVEEHLARCEQCTADVKALRETSDLLREHRTALCPSPWTLYEFALSDKDPEGLIAAHMSTCDECRKLVADLGADVSPEPMPDALWTKIQQRLINDGTSAGGESSQPTELSGENWLYRLIRPFRFPALAAAVAAILTFIFIYPQGMSPETIALSSVAWDNAPRPKNFDATAKRLAMVLVLKDFEERFSQRKIDALYGSLEPSMAFVERYQVLFPSQVSEALKSARPSPSDTGALLTALRETLAASKVLLLTVRSTADGLIIDAQLLDTATGALLSRKRESAVPRTQLEFRLRAVAFGLIGVSDKSGMENK